MCSIVAVSVTKISRGSVPVAAQQTVGFKPVVILILMTVI